MKITLILGILLLFNSLLTAQQKITEFQAGVLMPKDAQTGFIAGVSMGRAIDQNIAWAVELDYYVTSYTEETTVQGEGGGQINPDQIVTKIENSTRMLPIFFKLVYTSQVSPSLDLRVSGGLGYEFMWNSEVNHEKNIDETRYYHGFAWFIGGGLSIPVSQASDLFAQINYHGGSPSRDEGTNVDGLPVRTEVDMSGVMFFAGFRIYNFGFF